MYLFLSLFKQGQFRCYIFIIPDMAPMRFNAQYCRTKTYEVYISNQLGLSSFFSSLKYSLTREVLFQNRCSFYCSPRSAPRVTKAKCVRLLVRVSPTKRLLVFFVTVFTETVTLKNHHRIYHHLDLTSTISSSLTGMYRRRGTNERYLRLKKLLSSRSLITKKKNVNVGTKLGDTTALPF